MAKNDDQNLLKKIISHSKEYGFVFPSSEIYDGLSATYDYERFRIKLMAYEATQLSGEFTLSEHDEIAWVTAAQMKSYHMSKADLSIIDYLMKN